MRDDWKLTQKQSKWLLAICLLPISQTRLAHAAEEVIRQIQPGDMLVKKGEVKFRPATKPEISAGQPQPLGFGDSLHTLQLARATVRFIDWSTLRMKELTLLEVQGATQKTAAASLRLQQGQVYVSSRGPVPAAIPMETPHVYAVPKGTEFLVAVDLQAARTEVTMFDGEAQLQGANDPQPVRVRSGQQGIAILGQPTQVRPILQAQNIVQWWLYYPGILEVGEIGLTTAEQTQFAASLAAYRQGDVQRALTNYPGYPAPPEPTSDAQRTYLAGLFLAVGAVDRSDALLNSASSNLAPVRALRTMIRAVTTDFHYLRSTRRAETLSSPYAPASSSEWLALSYAHQATNNLKDALESARKAIVLSPTFGFGWARVGELEFSFGHTHAAREAALSAIKFSPRNAQAHALNGFLLAAEDRIKQALAAFDQAIEIDPDLGNAWLGRGLCKRRLGWFLKSTLDGEPASRQ